MSKKPPLQNLRFKWCENVTSSTSYGSAPNYLNNTFTDNGTAVCINNLPGTEVLDFAGSIFSGNDTDIDNKAEHPVDTAKAAFQSYADE